MEIINKIRQGFDSLRTPFIDWEKESHKIERTRTLEDARAEVKYFGYTLEATILGDKLWRVVKEGIGIGIMLSGANLKYGGAWLVRTGKEEVYDKYDCLADALSHLYPEVYKDNLVEDALSRKTIDRDKDGNEYEN